MNLNGINRKFYVNLRSFCTKITDKHAPNSAIKDYQEIPGPKGFLGLGTLPEYLPIVGKYSWDSIHKSGFIKYQKWGSLVKETMIPGVDVLWLFDPNDISVILNDSSGYPRRKSHLALEKYRKDRPHIYRTGGLLPTNGEEWWNIRSELQKGLSSPQHVKCFLSNADQITREFINESVKNPDIDFLEELSRLNLELVCFLAFDVRMKSFSSEERTPYSKTSKLIESAEATNSCILPTDQGFGFWKLFETSSYKKLRKAQEFMESVAIDLVSQKTKNNLEESSKSVSFFEEYLRNPKLKFEDVIGMACDLLLAGIDTTTYTTSFALYHISRNRSVQEKLFDEILTLLPDPNGEITADILNSQIPYTKAVLKETFRLNPVSVGVGRILNKDVVLSGYKVPAGTVAVTQNFVACRLEKNFTNAEVFDPEKWLKRSDKQSVKYNPYLVLPFGHGMRSCIARRLAEQSILIFIIRLIRTYQIEWAGEEKLDVVTKLINKPNKPIKIKFKQRN